MGFGVLGGISGLGFRALFGVSGVGFGLPVALRGFRAGRFRGLWAYRACALNPKPVDETCGLAT